MKDIKKMVIKGVVRRKGLAFIFGHKAQTDKGLARVDGLLRALRALLRHEGQRREARLDEVEKISRAINGLFEYRKGTEAGLMEYERLGTEKIIKEIIGEK